MFNVDKMVANAQYNASGTNHLNWLNVQRMQYSSWEDTQDDTQTDSGFGVDGFTLFGRVYTYMFECYIPLQWHAADIWHTGKQIIGYNTSCWYYNGMVRQKQYIFTPSGNNTQTSYFVELRQPRRVNPDVLIPSPDDSRDQDIILCAGDRALSHVAYPLRGTQLVTEIWNLTSWILLLVSRLKNTSIRFHRQCFPLALESLQLSGFVGKLFSRSWWRTSKKSHHHIYEFWVLDYTPFMFMPPANVKTLLLSSDYLNRS